MLEQRKFSLQLKKADQRKPKLDTNKEGLYSRNAKSNIDSYINSKPNKSIKELLKEQLSQMKTSLPLKYAYERTPIKSQHQISINSLHKQRIVEQRRSYSFSKAKSTKKRSYSINEYTADQLDKLPHSSTENPVSLEWETLILRFNSQYYRQSLEKGKIAEAFDKIAVLLNYSIDIGNRNSFFKIVSSMCQFYEVLEQHKKALRLYVQYKQAALLQKDYKNLILSLIGIARCAATSNLLKQSIIILKKALDYSWYINNTDLELQIYDELGQKYYRMGEVEKATTYHTKYSSTLTEPDNSPLRLLSKQQLQFLAQANITHNYENLSPLFIAHLNLPLKTLENLPSLAPGLMTSRQKLYQNNIFNQDAHEIQTEIKRLFRTWMFLSETEEPSLENVKQAESKKMLYNSKKYAYIDFKMNRHFKNKGIKVTPQMTFQKQKLQQSEVKKKMSLDEKIKVLVKEPGLEKQWYQSIIKRVQIDQKRKLAHISDPVRITRNHNSYRSKVESLKIVFKQIIDFVNCEISKNNKRLL